MDDDLLVIGALGIVAVILMRQPVVQHNPAAPTAPASSGGGGGGGGLIGLISWGARTVIDDIRNDRAVPARTPAQSWYAGGSEGAAGSATSGSGSSTGARYASGSIEGAT